MHLNSTRKIRIMLSAEYSICGSVLPVVSSVTDLGVSYDNRFSFRPHIINVVSKAAFTPAQHVARQHVARDKQHVACCPQHMLLVRATCCRATCWADVNAALKPRLQQRNCCAATCCAQLEATCCAQQATCFRDTGNMLRATSNLLPATCCLLPRNMLRWCKRGFRS